MTTSESSVTKCETCGDSGMVLVGSPSPWNTEGVSEAACPNCNVPAPAPSSDPVSEQWMGTHICGNERGGPFATKAEAEAWVEANAKDGDGLGGCWDVFPVGGAAPVLSPTEAGDEDDRLNTEAARYLSTNVPGWDEMEPYMQLLAVGKLVEFTRATVREEARRG